VTDGGFPRRGDIFWIDFDPARGSEQAGYRPGCVISMDSFNRTMPVVVVAAMTSVVKTSRLALTLPAGEPMEREGQILPFQVTTVDKSRLEDYAGSLSAYQVLELERRMRLCWGL
jgi:mRNA interferase MazF